MPRKARVKSKTGIYHVIVRGINGQTIFKDDVDYLKFVDTLFKCKEKSAFEIYAYCLMNNHIHLLMREGRESLSLSMQRLSSSFVYWYNWKHNRFGHLFQERYKSEVVESEDYLLTVLRYIHQNPVKAGITNSVSEFKWSSYHEYINKPHIIDTNFILELFAQDEQLAKREFVKFNNEVNEDVCLEYEEIHRISDEELIKLIRKKYDIEIDFFPFLERGKMTTIMQDLKLIDGVTIRQLVRVTGVSKYKVEKA